ncbi:unnamed protein product [Psylliodes chrysocephalus]|uniref:Uncharacterized protein n=1 Tax=Psylliodes chrysocephalus TaxID=3402493 RepID=A0A9P0CV56_9CUCU|nr:unnamed protein product [Psylliodes chrysocephala]
MADFITEITSQLKNINAAACGSKYTRTVQKRTMSKAFYSGFQDYQLKLNLLYLLDGTDRYEEFKLSTKNEDAANFDDVVYETPEDTTLVQAIHFPEVDVDQKINKYDLFKYLADVQNVKFKTDNIRNVIICIYCTSPESINKFLSNEIQRCVKDNSVVPFENVKCYSFDQNEDLEKYISENKPEIPKNVVRSSLDKLLLVPISENDLDQKIQKLIEKMQILSNVMSPLLAMIIILDKIKTWYNASEGTYLTEKNLLAYIAEINCTIYIDSKIKASSESLKEIAFKDKIYSYFSDNINNNNLLLIKIENKESYKGYELIIWKLLLEKLKSENRNGTNKAEYELLEKMLFVDPEVPLDTSITINIIESFELPKYSCLVIPIFGDFRQLYLIKSELKKAINIQREQTSKRIIAVSNIARRAHLCYFFSNFKIIDEPIVNGMIRFSNLCIKLKETNERKNNKMKTDKRIKSKMEANKLESNVNKVTKMSSVVTKDRKKCLF